MIHVHGSKQLPGTRTTERLCCSHKALRQRRTQSVTYASATAAPPLSKVTAFLETVPHGNAVEDLRNADMFWHALCHSGPPPLNAVVQEVATSLPHNSEVQEFDVLVLGGTLGIFLAAALALRGKRVAVVERNQLRGRDQEWNISRADMKAFVEEGVLTEAEVDEVLVTEFNPVRVAFEGHTEIITRDILNCGASPKRMVELLKERFQKAGGVLMEGTNFRAAEVHPDGVLVHLTQQAPGSAAREAGGAGGAGNIQLRGGGQASTSGRTEREISLRTEVLVDAMGSFSPIANQSRQGTKPDSVVLMVGSCAQGLPPCSTADLLYSFTPINRQRQLQYFWEIFPASDGQTTYMFSYSDCSPGRATLEEMYQDYLELLPQYRGIADLQGVKAQRVFFGVVPNWHASPPKPATARLLHVGDSAGNRSALSFAAYGNAGFGAMARHLGRLRRGLEEALDLGLLDRDSLQLLQPRSPAINMTAAMQFSMGTRAGQNLDAFDDQIINDYIGSSFTEMKKMGPAIYRPFMQDFLQWRSLSRIVGRQVVYEPMKLVQMTRFMASPKAGAMFASNFLGLFWYDLLFRLATLVAPVHEAVLPPALLYRWHRLVDGFKFGSANDYEDPNLQPDK